jgi:hypothetical protein
VGHACVAACWACADMGLALSTGRTCSGRARACSDMGIAGACGAGATRTSRVRSAAVRAGARMGRARARGGFLITARIFGTGCSSGLGRRCRACAFVGSAGTGWTSGVAVRTRSGPASCWRAFVGRPRRSGCASVGSACFPTVAPPDGALLESARPGLERAAAARFRSSGARINGLGRAASRISGTTADRRALLERACAARLGRSA